LEESSVDLVKDLVHIRRKAEAKETSARGKRDEREESRDIGAGCTSESR
jgi:hypothetical protein